MQLLISESEANFSFVCVPTFYLYFKRNEAKLKLLFIKKLQPLDFLPVIFSRRIFLYCMIFSIPTTFSTSFSFHIAVRAVSCHATLPLFKQDRATLLFRRKLPVSDFSFSICYSIPCPKQLSLPSQWPSIHHARMKAVLAILQLHWLWVSTVWKAVW